MQLRRLGVRISNLRPLTGHRTDRPGPGDSRGRRLGQSCAVSATCTSLASVNLAIYLRIGAVHGKAHDLTSSLSRGFAKSMPSRHAVQMPSRKADQSAHRAQLGIDGRSGLSTWKRHCGSF